MLTRVYPPVSFDSIHPFLQLRRLEILEVGGYDSLPLPPEDIEAMAEDESTHHMPLPIVPRPPRHTALHHPRLRITFHPRAQVA